MKRSAVSDSLQKDFTEKHARQNMIIHVFSRSPFGANCFSVKRMLPMLVKPISLYRQIYKKPQFLSPWLDNGSQGVDLRSLVTSSLRKTFVQDLEELRFSHARFRRK
jgi:hypothetical protein